MTAAWTTPRTWVATETVTAALLNIHVRDNLDAIGGAWTAYVPTISQVGSSGVVARYRSVGKTIDVRVLFNLTGAPTGNVTVSLPVAASTAFGTGTLVNIGQVVGSRGGTFNHGTVTLAAAGSVSFNTSGSAAVWAAAIPVAWVSTDDWHFWASYEAA